jgi:hypothetical protein
MTSTGLDVFNTTLQKTNAWLKWLQHALHAAGSVKPAGS